MAINKIRALLVEDDLDDVLILKESLAEVSTVRFKLVNANCLSDGLKFAKEQEFDVILLDLNLPDSYGLDTLISMHAHSPQLPIIVLTGLNSEEMAIQTVQAGAQDYLVKGQISPELLSRSIRYAIERQHMLGELEVSQQREQEARDLASLKQLSQASQTSVTEQAFGVLGLQKSAPEFFNTLVQHFEQYLEMSVEQRILRVEFKVEGELFKMAEQLGSVKASPRDVIDIYLLALETLKRDAKPQKVQVYNEEGRFLVLRLMGDLVSFYRKYFTSKIQNPATTFDSNRNESEK